MIYGYIRVSTDKQTVENQRFEVARFCEKTGIQIEKWIEETISGTKPVEKRQLGGLLKEMQAGDMIVCSELSRLGRTLFMIMDVLSECMKKGVVIKTVKENYTLGDDISSKVLAFAFGLSAEIERNLISQRTKEALHRLQAEGKTLGRPKGARTRAELHPLYKKDDEIKAMLNQGLSQRKIAKALNVNRNTLWRFLQKASWFSDKC